MQNQESPQTDNDVIDWIVENLEEKSRTRRAVIKKLKELGLIFKAPTKKSTAAAVNRNLFIKDEDDKLRELYDEHRLDEDCLRKIMEVFNKKRSKKAVVRRMVQLGLIADEFEVMPAKQKGKRNMEENFDRSSSSSEEDYNFDGPREARYTRNETANLSTSHYKLNSHEISSFRIELEEALKESIEWIVEALNDAAEDFEEPSDELSDAIPLVPLSQSQKFALENPQFQGLLRSINLIEPYDGESYWKIPANMMPNELQKRAQLLQGNEILNDNQSEERGAKNNSESDNNDDDSDLFSRLRAQREALIYNKSDDNEDIHFTVGDENNVSKKKKIEKKKKKKSPTKEMNEMNSSASEDDDEQMVIKRKKKKKKSSTEENQAPKEFSEEFAINTQELKDRLAELESSDNDEDKSTQQQPLKQSTRKALESSDEEEMPTNKHRLSEKRERSPNENEMNVSNNQKKKIRRIIDSDDE